MKDMNFESPKWRRSALETEVVVEDGAARRRRRNIMLAAIAAIVLILVVAFVMMRGGSGGKPAAAAASGEKAGNAAPRVTVIVPGRQQVARVISATGTIAARRDMPVGVSGEGGMVVRVMVEPGQWVRAGQSLAVIERSVQSQQASQLAAQIQVAQADARLAQSELDRALSLVSRGFVSKADVDRKRATRDAANARVRVAQAQLGETRARIGRLDIRAPASGLILTRNLEAGQVVGAGSGALFRIAQNGEMEVQAKLSEEDLASVHAGVPATVTPVGSNITIAGRLWQVAPVVDPTSRQGIARVAVPYQPALRPGGFASVSLTSGSADVPLLPQSAVLSDAQGNYVYVLGADNKVQRRDVKIGDVDDQGVTVTAGLNGTERVIVSAGAFLNPGDKIIPVREAARP
jgi:RND family efflux transporter MFP subunit